MTDQPRGQTSSAKSTENGQTKSSRTACAQRDESVREWEQWVTEKLKRNDSPQRSIEDLELADIIDSQAIQSMMDDFFRVARIPMSIIDLKGKVLVGVGWQDICIRFHRTHPGTCKHCIESDTRLSAGIPRGEFRLYKCLNNMWDIATPLFVCGKHMGNVFSGQFFFDDEPIDYDLFRSQARKYGFDENEYMAALESVPRLSRSHVEAGMSFFIKIADLISSVSYSNIHLGQSLVERDALMVSLRENKEDLNRAQAVAHTGSWRLDVGRNELTWSDETSRMFGIPEGTPLTYENFLSFVHPEDREHVDREWSAAMRGEPYEIEHRIIVGDTVKWVREKAELEFGKEGLLLGGFGTVQDITERKQAEEALRESEQRYKSLSAELELRVNKRTAELKRKNQELEEFAFVASHDLSEPLRKIQTFGSLLEANSENRLDEQSKDFISRMTGASNRMQELLDALLRYSRVETRGEQFRPVRLNDIVKDATGDLEIAIRNAGVQVEIGPLPIIKGDPYQWRQVFQNLIANAAKYHRSEVKPFIKIYGEENDGACHVFVEDNGIGFDEKYLDKIFQPFQRLHGRNEYSGTGIGLAICKKIVEHHGGTITAKSTPGKGSVFILTLPAKQGEKLV